MADGAGGAGLAVARARLSFWQRFPWRRSVLWSLGIGIGLGVGLGSYQTLTMPDPLPASFWRDLVIVGLARGSIYALIALGYTLVYGILLMINFAHGEVFMAGAFASFFVAATLSTAGFIEAQPALSIVILLLVACSVSMLIAIVLERVAYRPLRGAPRLVPLITAIGASLFIQNSFRGFFGVQTRGYPRPSMLDGTWVIFGVPVHRMMGLTIVFAVVSLIVLVLFVSRSRTGKAMRAVAQDKEIASLMGINVDRVVMTTFAIGGIMAGIAAVMFALTFTQVNFFMGFFPGIKAFTAAVLGGIGSITGAALGGLILGVLEAVGPTLFLEGFGVPSPIQLRDVIAFTILVLVLIFRPGGILGTGEAEKV